MIPHNITKQSVLNAIKQIDEEGVPKGRESTKYNLIYNGKLYPPKYTLALANLIENSVFLKSDQFNGGKETNYYLKKLGFEIVGGNLSKEDSSQEVKIASAIIQSEHFSIYHGEDIRPWDKYNHSRLNLLDRIINELDKNVDVLLLPAGYLKYDEKVNYYYDEIEEEIKKILNKYKSETVVCIGVDGRDGMDQIGMAINKDKILGIGRKFYPTDGEKNVIQLSSHYLDKEDKYRRIIDVKGKKLYIAICYDSFGIRKMSLKNPGIDVILNLAHRFNPKGFDGSGEVYFAKYGFAGSSKEWKCPTFGTATFYHRDIPVKFPAGVLWGCGEKNVQQWKYDDNVINIDKIYDTSLDFEKAEVRVYSL